MKINAFGNGISVCLSSVINSRDATLTQVMTLEELEKIADLCRKHDVIVVSDEVYEWLVYPPRRHIRIGQLLFAVYFTSLCLI